MSKRSEFQHLQDHLPLSAFGESLVAPLTGVMAIKFPYNINSRLITTTASGSGAISTTANALAIVTTGATASSTAELQSRQKIDYVPGSGVDARFTMMFESNTTGTTQLIGLIDSEDGFAFGYNGTTFGVLRRSGGVDDWTAQTDWNGDKMDGSGLSGMTLDPTKLQVAKIDFQWLGAGAVEFFLEDTNSNRFSRVHTIIYANQNTVPTCLNPDLPFCAYVSNSGTTDNLKVYTASMGAYEQGTAVPIHNVWATENNRTGITAGAESILVAIRNKTTYQSKTNKIQGIPKFLSAAAEASGNNTNRIRVYLNASITSATTTNWADMDSADSSFEVNNTSTTTFTGGYLVGGEELQKSGQGTIDLSKLDITLEPGDNLVVTQECAASSEASALLSWFEYM